MHVPFSDVGERRDDDAPAIDIPFVFASKHGVLLLSAQGDRIAIALREGSDPGVLLEVWRHLAKAIEVRFMDAPEFDRQMSAHYAADHGYAVPAGLRGAEAGCAADADGPPAIRLIRALLAEAAEQGVSDIHIEPYKTSLVVRLRTGGVLREMLRLPAETAPAVVADIKRMAGLDNVDPPIPQDGRLALTPGAAMGMSVSTLPNRTGERVVLRLSDMTSINRALDLPGLTGVPERIFRDGLAQNDGIVLIAGPGGSGKTTTLHAALRQLNDGSRTMLTVEDPVDRAIEGISQTVVNAEAGLTFATGLRAILRQDPDVVMVGEIRDRETAEIILQAAQTGHLILAAIHSKDAVGAITRMGDMRVEPSLLASALRGVIAQRLVRRLCQHCREPVQADKAASALLGFDPGTIIYKAGGCHACGGDGYKGRIGVFEAIRIDDTIRRLVNDGGDESLIARHAFLNAPNLGSAARALVRDGQTMAEEAIRVSRHDVTGLEAVGDR